MAASNTVTLHVYSVSLVTTLTVSAAPVRVVPIPSWTPPTAAYRLDFVRDPAGAWLAVLSHQEP